LAIRTRHQNESALEVARFLAGHARVAKVFYPFLETHPSHARARKLLAGGGAVLSFELKGEGMDGMREAAESLVKRVRIPKEAPSLGGVEALITRPATTSHSWIGAEARARYGISDGLIRYSVGIEDPKDLIADLEQALG
jgi:cystathionine beta-lyase/cystathionine gamma-synthase